jgi:hypothetical protein
MMRLAPVGSLHNSTHFAGRLSEEWSVVSGQIHTGWSGH